MATKKSIFSKYKQLLYAHDITQRTKESRDWFMKNLKNINIQQKTFLRDTELIQKNRPLPGRMFQFVYDPKTKETLPYWDKFPLSVVVGPAPGGFYGLNLHYLPPPLRLKLFTGLLEYATDDRYDEKTKLRFNYQLLNSVRQLKAYKPCFKHYLTQHLESKLMMIPPENWEIAVFLPTERFEGESKNKVWRDSKRSVQ